MYLFTADMCGNRELPFLSSSNMPFPFCPHYGGITRATNYLHDHSRFRDLLRWHSAFHCPALYWDLEAPSSLTWAVVLFHPAPGFSREGVGVCRPKRRQRGIEPHISLLHTAAPAAIRDEEKGRRGHWTEAKTYRVLQCHVDETLASHQYNLHGEQ